MLQDGWTAVQVACWYDRMKALGALLKWNPDLRLQDSVRFLDSHQKLSSPFHARHRFNDTCNLVTLVPCCFLHIIL